MGLAGIPLNGLLPTKPLHCSISPAAVLSPPAEEPLIATAEIITPPSSTSPAVTGTQRTTRVISLDVFRGITIAAMILVNDPGSWSHIYPPLEHAEWNGWTPTDLIFPAFLFMVGVSMTLSFASRVSRGISRRALAMHIVRRSALIFAIGLFLNGFPSFDFDSIRIMGVLQRIAVCYFVGGILYLILSVRKENADSLQKVKSNASAIAGIILFLLVGYWALMTFVPVPGYGAGHLGKDDNLGAYVDRTLMPGHLWSESVTWDPEGLLSTLPAIATLLIGILAGEWLRSDRNGTRKAAGLAASGLILLTAGRMLHPYFPINKNLWTSTFVLFTGGFSLVLLAAFYWAVDLRGWRKWAAPWLVFGMNAILAYVLAALVSEVSTDFEFTNSRGRSQTLHGWIYEGYFVPHASPVNASLAFAVFFVLVIFLLLWPFYKGRIFVRI